MTLALGAYGVLDLDAIAAFNAANERARAEYEAYPFASWTSSQQARFEERRRANAQRG